MDKPETPLLRFKKLTFGEGVLEVLVRIYDNHSEYALATKHVTKTVKTVEEVVDFVRHYPTNSNPVEVKIMTREIEGRLRRSLSLEPISLIVVDCKTGKPVFNIRINSTAAVLTNNPCSKDMLVRAITGKRATLTLERTGFKLVPGLEDAEFAKTTINFEDSEEFISKLGFVNARNINSAKFKEFVDEWRPTTD